MTGRNRARDVRTAAGRRAPALAMLALLCAAPLPTAGAQAEDAEAPAAGQEDVDELGRRVTNGETTTLAFKNVTLEDLIPFITESTGKVVIPRQELLNRRISVLNDRPIPQRLAVDYIFLALQQEGIAVVEMPDRITFRIIDEVSQQDVPVIGPAESVLGRTDFGTIAEKVYPLRNSTAESVVENALEDSLPPYATIAYDEDSNQIIVRGPIALLQRMERLVIAIDQPATSSLRTQTFRLRYSDAEQIKTLIETLFEEDEDARAGEQNFPRFFQGRRGRDEDDDQSEGAATSENLRVTANTQQNSVTVLAEPTVIAQIAQLIDEEWDVPLTADDVLPKVYQLEHSDPVKVAALLEGLFGSSSTTGTAAATGQQGRGGQGATPQEGSGAGRLAGQFTFQPDADGGRLIVIAKSPDNLYAIDSIIEAIDQPQEAGLPEIVELKHANAEELAEQLNALLATEGTIAQIPRQEEGLTEGSTSISPFSSQFDDAQQTDEDAEANLITFWWQRAQPPTENRGSSNLVGRLRIVPVWRQNAVMILSPPEYRASVRNLIEQLDQPGRQVLISAVVAEVSLGDATALGLRWGSGPIETSRADNAFAVDTTTTAQESDILGSLFDTSVLDATVDLNFVLQALNERSAVNILSEPKIFTSDNQEASFFDGQDIPVVTDTDLSDTGQRSTTRDYRAVGIALRARPRITINGDVDLRVNLQLSSIQPGQVDDDFVIIDRRETTTQLIVADGQTVVISGILRTEESDVKRKVPLLGDIPILGALFTSIETEVTNVELVAFITPSVVAGPTDLDRVNEPYRQRLDELRGSLSSDVEELEREREQ